MSHVANATLQTERDVTVGDLRALSALLAAAGIDEVTLELKGDRCFTLRACWEHDCGQGLLACGCPSCVFVGWLAPRIEGALRALDLPATPSAGRVTQIVNWRGGVRG